MFWYQIKYSEWPTQFWPYVFLIAVGFAFYLILKGLVKIWCWVIGMCLCGFLLLQDLWTRSSPSSQLECHSLIPSLVGHPSFSETQLCCLWAHLWSLSWPAWPHSVRAVPVWLPNTVGLILQSTTDSYLCPQRYCGFPETRVYVLTALLRHNSHAIQFTNLRSLVQVSLVHSHDCAVNSN